MPDLELNAKIRIIILFEYCKRSYGQSDNPEMHFYVIPELRDIDNEIIKANAVYLIDENLVRGGVDDDSSQTFPWIRRITSKGMDLIEQLVCESESNIQGLQDELKDKANMNDRISCLITYCFGFDVFPTKILNIAKKIVL
jgi:hypothetical protein